MIICIIIVIIIITRIEYANQLRCVSWRVCVYMFSPLQCLMGGWLFHYSYKCQPVDYSDDPIAIRVSVDDGYCWFQYYYHFTVVVVLLLLNALSPLNHQKAKNRQVSPASRLKKKFNEFFFINITKTTYVKHTPDTRVCVAC